MEGNFTKGCAWGVLLSLPLWGIIIALVKFVLK
ncbi:hypothetical protein N781_05260 [Pontibacillus halophilus JSM 076056 = DSM 19796]|uniref:Uncharacterized protein n=1 Tax=Pontibacillus halophilus JSM 076056 = DSM 19796 TaxID=1385510 RepID=A0A0A5GJ46_9BACI|nr:hypothetical protein N781_05260 [Pontibacillus halophilus JSM 076056 = DSM 19796]